jgi:hypothetical protein
MIRSGCIQFNNSISGKTNRFVVINIWCNLQDTKWLMIFVKCYFVHQVKYGARNLWWCSFLCGLKSDNEIALRRLLRWAQLLLIFSYYPSVSPISTRCPLIVLSSTTMPAALYLLLLVFATSFGSIIDDHRCQIIDLTHPFDRHTTIYWPGARPFQLSSDFKGLIVIYILSSWVSIF